MNLDRTQRLFIAFFAPAIAMTIGFAELMGDMLSFIWRKVRG